jgi:asparagine synthase (glutamine-hydrolysing)
MCGICGIVDFKSHVVEEHGVRAMMSTMKHRGPDDEGVFRERNIGLGFVRLSIIDLSPLGHQPMSADGKGHLSDGKAGRFVIVYNGEVYNYIELRDELKAKGYTFRSNTDTEVVLKSYVEWGLSCLDKFNGMWAFAVYDREKEELFCARDRYGIKPFYYYSDQTQFIFASEIPAILSVLKTRPAANKQAIFDYLVFNRTDQTEETFFDGIKKLQHGHILEIRNSQLEIKRWYDLRSKVDSSTGFSKPEEYRNLFSSAVGLRLRSDVPVGVCLSGGVDSSSIVSVLLKDHDKTDLNTFSAVYSRGETGDESEFIESFRNTLPWGGSPLRNMFFTTPTAETLLKDLNNFVRAHAEPIPSTSPYAQYKVMELARENVVVTLDGQGADEELAGYHYFFGFLFKDLLRRLQLSRLMLESGGYLFKHRSIYGLKSFAYFLLPEFTRSRLRVSEKRYILPEFSNGHYRKSVIAGELYGSGNLRDALLNHFEYKLEHLLKWEDRNSMWFSIEARVPFLDHRLVERTLASPTDMIINRGTTKYILREAMRGTLPEKIRTRRDKIGFGTPQDSWFRNEKLTRLAAEILGSESFKQREIVNPVIAGDLLQKHIRGAADLSKEIWKWINLELWFREFID